MPTIFQLYVQSAYCMASRYSLSCCQVPDDNRIPAMTTASPSGSPPIFHFCCHACLDIVILTFAFFLLISCSFISPCQSPSFFLTFFLSLKFGVWRGFCYSDTVFHSASRVSLLYRTISLIIWADTLVETLPAVSGLASRHNVTEQRYKPLSEFLDSSSTHWLAWPNLGV